MTFWSEIPQGEPQKSVGNLHKSGTKMCSEFKKIIASGTLITQQQQNVVLPLKRPFHTLASSLKVVLLLIVIVVVFNTTALDLRTARKIVVLASARRSAAKVAATATACPRRSASFSTRDIIWQSCLVSK